LPRPAPYARGRLGSGPLWRLPGPPGQAGCTGRPPGLGRKRAAPGAGPGGVGGPPGWAEARAGGRALPAGPPRGRAGPPPGRAPPGARGRRGGQAPHAGGEPGRAAPHRPVPSTLLAQAQHARAAARGAQGGPAARWPPRGVSPGPRAPLEPESVSAARSTGQPGGRGRGGWHRPTPRRVPPWPNPHLRRLPMSEDMLHHIIRWNVENLADRQAADAVRARIEWRYLLGFG
jgi:hypothetical protein